MLLPKISTLIHRLVQVMITETKTASIFLGCFSLLLGVGFIVGDSTNHGYYFLSSFNTPLIWAANFIIYGTIKISQSVLRIHTWLKVLNSLQGTWCWTFILLSIFIFNDDKILPGQVIYIYPVILEVWDFMSYTYKSRKNKYL